MDTPLTFTTTHQSTARRLNSRENLSFLFHLDITYNLTTSELTFKQSNRTQNVHSFSAGNILIYWLHSICNPISHNITWWMPPYSIHRIISFRLSHSFMLFRTSSYPELINSITQLNIHVYSMNFPLVTYDIDWLVATYEIISHCDSTHIKFWKLINHVSIHAIASCLFPWTLIRAGFGSGILELTSLQLYLSVSSGVVRGSITLYSVDNVSVTLTRTLLVRCYTAIASSSESSNVIIIVYIVKKKYSVSSYCLRHDR